MEWIKIDDKLPDVDELVIVCFLNGKRFIGHRLSYSNHGIYAWDVYTSHGVWTESENITHWMPLPESPNA